MGKAAAVAACIFLFTAAAFAGDLAPRGWKITVDPPTVHSLGVQVIVPDKDVPPGGILVEYWEVSGDDHTRPSADKVKPGLPLMRVSPVTSLTTHPAGTAHFAGSVLNLKPDTGYVVELYREDAGGRQTIGQAASRTRPEPAAPAPLRTLHVVPGDGGGTGSQEDPFRGLAAADSSSMPGDLILAGGGEYAPFTVTKSGEPGKPIIYQARSGETPVIDGKLGARPSQRGISAADVSDVWFEGLEIRNIEYGIVANSSKRLVVRRCNIHDVEYAVAATKSFPPAEGLFISDNVMRGPSTWPRAKGIEDARGVQVSGNGHIVCYNRVQGFADGIDTFGTTRTRATDRCDAVDIYGNDISEMTDDGIEVDYSRHNVRCFGNRLTNCFQGITEQPTFGGPIYVYRNAMYNIEVEPYKMHTTGEPATGGFLIFHNTVAKQGIPIMVWSRTVTVDNVKMRNNLYIGTPKTAEGEPTPIAMDFSTTMQDCDFDYDGFGGGPFRNFLRWNGVTYATFEEMKANAPIERNAVLVDAKTVFASGTQPPDNVKKQYPLAMNDLRLREGSAAIDAGERIPNINDDFAGDAPDLGAYELGRPLPHYGPRP